MSILLNQYITERSSILSADKNVYCFRVAPKATKSEIAKEVKRIFKVTPISVNILNVLGKKRTRGQAVGRSAGFKKAFVKIPAGSKIEFV